METKLSHKQHLDYIRKLSQVERSLLSSMQSLIDFQKKHTVNVSVTNPQESVKTPDIDKIIRALSIVNKNIEGSKVDISPLLKEVKSLDDTLKKLPKQMPTFEQKEAVEVSNLDTLSKKFESIEKAIKALKLKSPDVDVAVDLDPLKIELQNILVAVKSTPKLSPMFTRGKKEASFDIKEDQLNIVQTNQFIHEKFDEYKLLYEDFLGDEDRVTGIKYFLKGKVVAHVEYTYDSGRLTGAKKV